MCHRNFLEDSLFDSDRTFDVKEWGERNPKKMNAICEFIELKLDWRLQYNPTGGKAWHPWISFATMFKDWPAYRAKNQLDHVSMSYLYAILLRRFRHIRFTHKGDFRQCNLCWDSNYELNVAIEEDDDPNQKDVFLLKGSHVEALRSGKVVGNGWRCLGDSCPGLCMVFQGDRGDTQKFWTPSARARCVSFV